MILSDSFMAIISIGVSRHQVLRMIKMANDSTAMTNNATMHPMISMIIVTIGIIGIIRATT